MRSWRRNVLAMASRLASANAVISATACVVHVDPPSSISGIDGIALTKLDVLDGFKEIKVCTGYRLGKETLDRLPPMKTAKWLAVGRLAAGGTRRGDTPLDAEAAHAAGIKCIGVASHHFLPVVVALIGHDAQSFGFQALLRFDRHDPERA